MTSGVDREGTEELHRYIFDYDKFDLMGLVVYRYVFSDDLTDKT